MLSRSNCNTNCEPIKVITIPQPIFKSFKGKYFLGKSNILTFGSNTNAWAGLINPANSGVNLYVSVFTVSNLSKIPFLAQVWFNSTPLKGASISKNISASNTALDPIPKPKVKLLFQQSTENFLKDGTNVYDRVCPPESTIASDEDGKFKMPPGGSFIIFLPSPSLELIKAEIALGWWEQRC